MISHGLAFRLELDITSAGLGLDTGGRDCGARSPIWLLLSSTVINVCTMFSNSELKMYWTFYNCTVMRLKYLYWVNKRAVTE